MDVGFNRVLNRITVLEIQMEQVLKELDRLKDKVEGSPFINPPTLGVPKEVYFNEKIPSDEPTISTDEPTTPTDEPQYPIVELFKIFNNIPIDEHSTIDKKE